MSKKGSIKVNVNNIRFDSNNKPIGQCVIGLYSDVHKDVYPKDTNGNEGYYENIVDINDHSVSTVFKDIPYGTYAIMAIHDVKKTGKVDRNFIGMPRDGVGASRKAKGKRGPPTFDDASFELKTEQFEDDIDLFYMPLVAYV